MIVGVVVVATAARAPHANVAAELPWTAVSWTSVALLALAISAQFPAFAFLSDATNRGLLFRALQWSVPLVPMAFLLHAAWRLGLPLPRQVGLWVPAAVVIVGSLLSFAPWAVKAAPGAGTQRQPEIVLPALLVQEGELVRVLRERDELRAMPRDLLPRLREPFVVDANRYRFALRGLHEVAGEAADGAVPVAFEAAREPEAMPFEEVRDLVLRIAPLHAAPPRTHASASWSACRRTSPRCRSCCRAEPRSGRRSRRHGCRRCSLVSHPVAHPSQASVARALISWAGSRGHRRVGSRGMASARWRRREAGW